MYNSQSQATTDRNQLICDEYENGAIQANLAKKYGLSESRVYQILKEGNVSRRETPRRKRLCDSNPISPFHAQIGQDIAYRRNKLNMTVIEFAKAAGMTKERLRAIELGVKEATVTDLARLAKAAGLDIQALMTPRSVTTQRGAA